MLINKYFILLILFYFLNFFNAGKVRKQRPSILQEYKELLPHQLFIQFSSIYMDKTLKTIDKLKLLNNLFMELPEYLLKKLPLPFPFRQLPLSEQQKIHKIYYNKKLNFSEKFNRLENFLIELPEEKKELVPIRSIQEKNKFVSSDNRKNSFSMPKLVEFEVPVLLQFNGHLEVNLLKQYLSKMDFKLLKIILTKHGISEDSRSRLVGILLKKAYQLNSDNFPLPLNGDSREITEEIKQLGIRLMFGKNPYDNVDPFVSKFELLKYNSTNFTKYQKRQKVDEYCKESGNWQIPLTTLLQQNQDGQLILFPNNKLFIEKINFFP